MPRPFLLVKKISWKTRGKLANAFSELAARMIILEARDLMVDYDRSFKIISL